MKTYAAYLSSITIASLASAMVYATPGYLETFGDGRYLNVNAISADGSVIAGYNLFSGSRAFRRTEATLTDIGNGSVVAMSSNGDVIIGNNAANTGAFQWTATSGRYDLPPALPSSTSTTVSAVSADGAILTGTAGIGTSSRAFIWTASAGYRFLTDPSSGPESRAVALAANGLAVAGVLGSGVSAQAFIWTDASGVVPLGYLAGDSTSSATAISRDGSTVIGTSGFGPTARGFRWTEAIGIQAISSEPETASFRPIVVSADGKTIAGTYSPDNNTSPQLAIWKDTHGLSIIPDIPSFSGAGTYPSHISDDGSVVSGCTGTCAAFIWTEATGPVLLVDWLAGNGSYCCSPTDELLFVQAMSPNGTWVAGSGQDGSQNQFGYVASLSSLLTANNDSAVTGQDLGVAIPILHNDIYTDPATVVIASQPLQGTVSVSGSPGPGASIFATYTPLAGFLGDDSFEYLLGGSNGFDKAKVSITVLPLGANPDQITTISRRPVTLDVLANDVGFGTRGVALTIQDPPAMGGSSLVVNGAGTPAAGAPGLAAERLIKYIPDPSSLLTSSYQDTFVYQVAGPLPLQGDSFISIDGVAPTSFTIPSSADHPQSIGIFSPPLSGQVTFANTNDPDTFWVGTYTPSSSFSGTDRFTYFIERDGSIDLIDIDVVALLRSEAMVTVTVLAKGANDLRLTSRLDEEVMVFPTENDIGFEDPVYVSLLSQPAAGTAVAINADGTSDNIQILFRPSQGFRGIASFRYAISDATASDSAEVQIGVQLVEDDIATVAAGDSVTLVVTSNDVGFIDPVAVTIVEEPALGSVELVNAYGASDNVRLLYNAPAVLNEGTLRTTDRLTYRITDGLFSEVGAVNITVFADADSDGIPDDIDNCLGVFNPDQRDTDGDGYGNLCDADFNNDGVVNFADLAFFRSRFGTNDPDADLNGDGVGNFADLAIFGSLFGRPPGPSSFPH